MEELPKKLFQKINFMCNGEEYFILWIFNGDEI